MEKYKTLCAIIVNNKNEILLSKRAREPFKGCWSLISGLGASKDGMSPERGIIYEVGCDLGTNTFRGKQILTLPVKGNIYTNAVVVFLGKIDEKDIKLNPNDSLGIKWVSERDTKELNNLGFEHKTIIQEYLQKKHS